MFILLALVFELDYFFVMCINCMLGVLFGSVKDVKQSNLACICSFIEDLLALSKMPNKQCEL